MRITRLFVLLALAALLAPRAEASRASVWESNPPASLTATRADANGTLASLAPATAADAEPTETPRFDLGDIVFVENELEHDDRFGLGPLELLGPAPLRGPPPSYPETRVGGFELLPPFRVGASPTLNLWSRQACGFVCREVASDSRYDPWGLESIREWFGADADIKAGRKARGYAKKVGYGIWNALTFGFLGRHDEAFERYEQTGNTAAYVKDTAKEVGRAGVVGAATIATGGVAGGTATTLGGAAARGAIGGAVTSVAGTAAGDAWDRAQGEAGATAGDYISSAVGGAAFGGAAGAASFGISSALSFDDVAEGVARGIREGAAEGIEALAPEVARGPVVPTRAFSRRGDYGGSRTRGPVAAAIREAAEGSGCPNCGVPMISGTRNAPSPQHSPSLFEDFWLHGGHRRSRAENIFYADSPGAFDGAICRTCQHREGAALSAASKAWKDLFGF